MNRLGLASLLLGLLLLGGFCCLYPGPDLNTKRLVAESDLIGVWELMDHSAHLLGESENTANYIVFYADGTVEFNSLFGLFERHRIESSGKWKLHIDSSSGPKNRIKINLDKANYRNFDLLLRDIKDKPGFVIWNYFGDPDAGQLVEFMKLSSSTSVVDSSTPKIESQVIQK